MKALALLSCILTPLLLIVFISSCQALPRARGTWVADVQTIELADSEGTKCQCVQLLLQEAPLHPYMDERVLLVKPDGTAYSPEEVNDLRVRVSGLISFTMAVCPSTGNKLVRQLNAGSTTSGFWVLTAKRVDSM